MIILLQTVFWRAESAMKEFWKSVNRLSLEDMDTGQIIIKDFSAVYFYSRCVYFQKY